MWSVFRGIRLRSLKFTENKLYLEDVPGGEEVEFQHSEELRTASSKRDVNQLRAIHKRSPSSSDPACLLAQCYDSLGNISEARTILTDSLAGVKLKSHIAGTLGQHYLFHEPDFLLCLYWLLRSAIAQRKQPWDSGTYIYLYAVLSALNEYWFDALHDQAERCKLMADKLAGPGGIAVDYGVIQNLKHMYRSVPDIDISGDLKRALRCLGI